MREEEERGEELSPRVLKRRKKTLLIILSLEYGFFVLGDTPTV